MNGDRIQIERRKKKSPHQSTAVVTANWLHIDNILVTSMYTCIRREWLLSDRIETRSRGERARLAWKIM